MKTLMIGLTTLAFAITALGETFQMDRKGDAIVEANIKAFNAGLEQSKTVKK